MHTISHLRQIGSILGVFGAAQACMSYIIAPPDRGIASAIPIRTPSFYFPSPPEARLTGFSAMHDILIPKWLRPECRYGAKHV
ncbi:uncharacterized protein GGS22DRAFT_165836 [Annulohypoxylon maeteangense]|uniref:uncharacterized protein n=1 Tax=Annulohypoxylon maeteangense TaxID=1927788 RepID=UPI002008BD3A|nr:uncharacterized protein GGS22DRAFT_165836 [Annulohypoxylon maeteangense]KAI0883691.1 hypothetical protein GGS22DRAFT_165836 [Annulohypoxylon maeteangense]